MSLTGDAGEGRDAVAQRQRAGGRGSAVSPPPLADLFGPATEQQLDALLAGQPPYRLRQVRGWLARGVVDPAAMTDLPKALRDRLGAAFPAAPRIVRHVTADAGLTHKVLLELSDGEAIESVLMCYPRTRDRAARATVCISTQAGCAMGCPFCATGQAGLRRQLRTHEVVAQVAAAEQLLGDLHADQVPDHITNVVFMGMGEPLANLDVTIATLRWLTDREGFDLSARSVTVSTIGLVPAIRRLMAQAGALPITLAVSLHAPNDELRDQLVPINRQHPLGDLLDACDAYAATTRRRLTFEYVMIGGVNASADHAHQLADLLAPRRAHVNLIPMNPTPAVPWVAPAVAAQRRFAAVLQAAGLTATIRHNRGTNIDAACGQLYANYQVASGRRLQLSGMAPAVAPQTP